MRTRFIIILFAYLLALFNLFLAQYQQQGAKVIRTNPKYVKSASIFTTRLNRFSPYSTDLNITTLAAWGNNVTMSIQFYKLKAKSEALAIELKTCDLIKHKWVQDWVEKFSNLSISACPIKFGIYRFTGFEVPPKNFPFLVLEKNTDYKSMFLAYVTKTKESIVEFSMDLKFETKSNGKRNKIKAK